jgi:hypothetical protein
VTFIRVPAHSPERTAAYEKWYDTDHIPKRMAKPGFLGAQRYDMVVGRQRYFVIYELEDPSAVVSPEYLALREWEAAQPPDSFEGPATSRPGFERATYIQTAGPDWPDPALEAPVVHVAGFQPTDAVAEAFEPWLVQKHLPVLGAIPGVVAVRQFAIAPPNPDVTWAGMRTLYPRVFTAAYLESESVIESPEFVAAQRAARAEEDAPDREPYVVVGRLVFTAHGQPAAAR